MQIPARSLGKTQQALLGLGLFALVLGLEACGANKEEDSQVKGPIHISWPAADRVGVDDGAVPPFELHEQSFVGSGRFNSVFWLDFEGDTVSANESFIVQNAGLSQVTIPPFQPSDIRSTEDRQALILQIVQNLVPLFPDVDIKLTLEKPQFETFSHVHIGGRNFTGKARVLGIAPLDLGNRSGSDVIFAYSQELRDLGDSATLLTELTHVIAHEMAHALGARHLNSDAALMKPSVSLVADTFNVSAPVVDAPKETENSLQVLLNSAGSRTANFTNRPLPEIVDLAAFSTAGVIQYTVLSSKNFSQNPGLNLADYRYSWTFEGKSAEGSSVLLTFPDHADHTLNLTVTDDRNQSRKFQFIVGHRQ